MRPRDKPDVSRKHVDQMLEQPLAAAQGRGRCQRVKRMDCESDRTIWLVSGYEAFKRITRDPRFSADHFNPGYPSVFPVKRRHATGDPPPLRTYSGMDPPCHGFHRRMVSNEFAYRRCEALRPWIRGYVERRLDDLFAVSNPADLVTDYAEPIASEVICSLLGLPCDARSEWTALSRQLVGNGRDRAAVASSSKRFRLLVARFVANKEIDRGDDLTSRLIQKYEDASRYDSAQIVEFIGAIFLAGLHSTASMIVFGALTLLDHPEAARSIATGDEDALSSTVNELLRFHSIADRVTARVALEDVVIEGQRIAAGEGVVASSAGANMDPSMFECPELFDPARRARHQMSFGYGRHRCLGEHLARVEIAVALAELFSRYTDLALAEGFHRPWIDESCVFRRLKGPLMVMPVVDQKAR